MSGSWKVAYADFVTAMMAFFLLMWILSQASKETKEGLAGYFSAPGGFAGNPTIVDFTAPPSSTSSDNSEGTGMTMSPAESTNLAVRHFISDHLTSEQLQEKQFSLSMDETGVLLRVNDELLFDENKAEISAAGYKLLDVAVMTMRNFQVNLVVRGHADPSETGEPYFESKWVLAAARAAVATQYLIEKGSVAPNKIMSASFGDSMPIVPGSSKENRRIEFYFYRPELKVKALGF